MRILLVDDEPIILHGLERIIRRRWPDFDIDARLDARAALEAMRAALPDLMITDIYMPEIDGLELIERARELGVERCAILTGHDSFSFAQKAVRLKALDYLLKPVDKEELYALIGDALDAMEEKKAERQAALLQRVRLLALYGIPSESLGEPESRFACAMICVSREAPPPIVDCTALTLWETESRRALLWLSDRPLDEFSKSVYETLAGGDAIEGVAVAAFDEDSLHAMYKDVIAGGGSAASIFLGGEADYGRASARLAAELCSEASPLRAVGIMEDFLQATRIELPVWSAVECVARLRAGEMDAPALAERLAGAGKHAQIHSEVVAQAMEHIGRNYQGRLTLPDIAKKVYLQPNYFSTLFHSETGRSYIQYLNRKRIEHACRAILRYPERSFEQIARECGLSNLRYFFRAFKRYTGYTPGEFRELQEREG